jgi:hypothetical protein
MLPVPYMATKLVGELVGELGGHCCWGCMHAHPMLNSVNVLARVSSAADTPCRYLVPRLVVATG